MSTQPGNRDEQFHRFAAAVACSCDADLVPPHPAHLPGDRDERMCAEPLCITVPPHHTHSDADGRLWCCGPYPYALAPAAADQPAGGEANERAHAKIPGSENSENAYRGECWCQRRGDAWPCTAAAAEPPTTGGGGPEYTDLACHRGRHEDGGWYCVAHGQSWPCSPPVSSAGQDTERLRDEPWDQMCGGTQDETLAHAVAKTIGDWMAAPHEPEDWQTENAQQLRDRLLAGPLRQLIAERDEARAAVQRVREVKARYSAGRTVGLVRECVTEDLRRALDGDS